MSNIEYEAKIYDVDPADITEKLTNLGAKEVGNYNFCRYVFDTMPAVPDRWVRLRSDGKQATLTVKEITADTIDGTHEWEVEVSDMETTLEILAKIGIKPRGYQENKHQEYDLDGVQVVIDRWPKLKPYVEIEANSVAEVVKTAALLGFAESDLITKSTSDLYRNIGIDIEKLAELKFDKQTGLRNKYMIKTKLPTDTQIKNLHKKYAKTDADFALIYTHCQVVDAIAAQLLDSRLYR